MRKRAYQNAPKTTFRNVWKLSCENHAKNLCRDSNWRADKHHMSFLEVLVIISTFDELLQRCATYID